MHTFWNSDSEIHVWSSKACVPPHGFWPLLLKTLYAAVGRLWLAARSNSQDLEINRWGTLKQHANTQGSGSKSSIVRRAFMHHFVQFYVMISIWLTALQQQVVADTVTAFGCSSLLPWTRSIGMHGRGIWGQIQSTVGSCSWAAAAITGLQKQKHWSCIKCMVSQGSRGQACGREEVNFPLLSSVTDM